MTMQKFSNQQNPDWPAVTVRKNGSISINNKATEQFGLKEMRFVTLHYDGDEKLFGIKPEKDNSDPSVYRISREKDRTPVVSCLAFLKHCGILYGQGSKVFKARWDDRNKMIVISLQQNHSEEVKT